MELKNIRKKDIREVSSWVKNEKQLMLWAGPVLSWPLTQKQFSTHIEQSRSDSFSFGLYHNKEILGYCELSGCNIKNKSASVSRVIISPDKRKKGYGFFMLNELLEFGFNDLALHRISLGVFDFNENAIKCYEKLGFKKEGVLRESACVKDTFWNCNIMSILAREWDDEKQLRADRDKRENHIMAQ